MSNVNLILWAIPAGAFLMVFVLLVRKAHRTSSSFATVEAGHEKGLSGAAAAWKPQASLPECETPWFASQLAECGDAPAKPTRNEFGRLCREFAIREVSVLPSGRHACGRAEANLEVLIEFDPKAKVDYLGFFRLRQELSVLLGRQVDIVCKGDAERRSRRRVAQAQLLYAA